MRRPDDGVVLTNKVTGRYAAGVFGAVAALSALWWVLPLATVLLGDDGGAGSYVALAVSGAFLFLMVWCASRSLSQRVTVRSEGLHTRGILASRSVPWSQVSGFAIEPTATTRAVWWVVLVLLRDSDRVVRLSPLYTRDRAEARSAEDRLRSLAPAGTRTDDRLGERPPPPVPAGVHRPGRRDVIRSWGYSKGGGILVLAMWGGVAFMAMLVGLTLVFDPDGSPTGGVVTIVVTCVLTGLVALWCRPRVVVTAQGVRPGRWRRRIPWADVVAITLEETVNEMMTVRRSYVALDTPGGRIPLWGTLRPRRRIDSVYARVSAFRPTG